MILTKRNIIELMKNDPPLIENMKDLEIQIQENGVDLTIGEVLIPIESGLVNFNNEIRQICRYSNMYPLAGVEKEKDINYFDLPYGQCYIIRLKERINLPKNIMAITKPRSSLIRNGVYIQSAIWDAGYHGRGHIMLIVENPYGIKLTYDARICQMIFIKLNKESLGYSGIFQEE